MSQTDDDAAAKFVPRMDLSDFHVLCELGRGKKCRVLLCQDRAGNFRALKTVARSSVISKADSDALFNEKDLLWRLRNIFGIVRLHGTGNSPRELSFVLDAALGGPLYRHVRAHGRLSLPSATFYTAEIIVAVSAMHALGIIHRDIKLSNILLDESGHIKLIDLGCAKYLPDRLHRTRTYCGTIHAMAPEMVRREGHSFPADLWSIGVAIYEMLTGCPPFPYGTGDPAADAAIVEKISKFSGQPIEDLPTDRSPLEDLMQRLLQPLPSDRLGFECTATILHHICFTAFDVDALNRHQIKPPEFRRDLGELEYLCYRSLPESDRSAFDGF